MKILNNKHIDGLLTLHEVIAAVEQALFDYEANEALVPKRMHLDKDGSTLLCMPAWGSEYFGTKLVAVFPNNKLRSLAVTNGAMVLNDSTSGLPLSLLNASKLTALRTGAVGAIGVKLLTPPDVSSIGLIGLGVQGLHQALFACAVRPLQTIYFVKRSDSQARQLKDFLRAHRIEVDLAPCKSADELLEKTTVLIAATTSATPVLPGNVALLKNKHFISIGSYKPTMQELPDEVFKLAGELYIDSEFARYETGDSINPVKNGWTKEAHVYTIGKLLNKTRRADINGTTVYKSAGMALFDLYVAQAMYKKASELKIGYEFEL